MAGQTPLIHNKVTDSLIREDDCHVRDMKTMSDTQHHPRHPPLAPDNDSPWPRSLLVMVAVLTVAAACFMLTGGPRLGDHEVIVAQTARQTLQSGHWLVPDYLDTPFLVKPPLSAWLVAAFSMYMPPSAEGLPVSDVSARLPSMLATILTVFIVWRLARSIYPRHMANMAGFIAATSVGMLLFAVNATAEALLVLFCTWAFAEFWWSQQATVATRSRMHLARFYIALGLAMLAKGPMPMPMVALPIAVWWWTERGMRLLSVGGPRRIGRIAAFSVRDFLPRLRLALTSLGLWWGIPLFLLVFLPWMIGVARQEPYAWQLWNYEFLDRARGDYPGCEWGDFHYYLPILFGMMLPWCLSLPEALISPFLRFYAPYRKPLIYAWCWVIVPLIFASAMSFKKPYYILPIVPGCVLLLAPVLYRFFFVTVIASQRRAKWAVAGILAILAAIPIVGGLMLPRLYPEAWHGSVVLLGVAFSVMIFVGMSAAAIWYVQNHRQRSFIAVGATAFVCFTSAWCVMGPALGNLDTPMNLVAELHKSGVSDDAAFYWASNRPDGRVVFYGQRPLRQIIDPYKLIAQHHRRATGDEMRMMVASRICALLEGSEPVYLVMQREDFDLLMSFMKPPARKLFSIDRGDVGHCDDDWIVLTNEGVAQRGGANAAAHRDGRPST